ncbi:MAG TPA: glycosyltransferase, partial [Chroococcidiopsis sp.]
LRWLATHTHDFDIAHIHALFSPVSSAAATVSRFKKLPYLLRPLGTLDPSDLRKKKALKQLYAALIERPNLAGAAAIHFTSAQEAAVSERFGVTTRDLVMPLGVVPSKPVGDRDTILRELGIPLDPNTPRLLFMSRIDPKKGFDLLIPALETLVAEGVDFHIVIAGGNPQDPAYEAQTKARIQASKLGDHATFTGFVTGDAKTALLEWADLFVLPSYYENFGIAVAEAMVAGLPVVISDQVHICNEIQQAEAGWVVPCQIEPLTAALRSALTHPGDRHHRGQQAQAYALEHYSWDAIAAQMLHTYAELLGHKN